MSDDKDAREDGQVCGLDYGWLLRELNALAVNQEQLSEEALDLADRQWAARRHKTALSLMERLRAERHDEHCTPDACYPTCPRLETAIAGNSENGRAPQDGQACDAQGAIDRGPALATDLPWTHTPWTDGDEAHIRGGGASGRKWLVAIMQEFEQKSGAAIVHRVNTYDAICDRAEKAERERDALLDTLRDFIEIIDEGDAAERDHCARLERAEAALQRVREQAARWDAIGDPVWDAAARLLLKALGEEATS